MGLMSSHVSLPAQTSVSREYQLKAAFLLNFARFVEWPEKSFLTTDSPIIIGILGNSPFDTYLEEIISDEKIKEHPVIVHYYKSTEEIKICHILFINLTETKLQKQALTYLKGRSILTVSDASQFLKSGGIIKFFTRDNKIKLQINLEATKTSNLVISSRLLKLAEIFNQKENS
jgi:hypothetical protein